jgi:hypothetical protein
LAKNGHRAAAKFLSWMGLDLESGDTHWRNYQLQGEKSSLEDTKNKGMASPVKRPSQTHDSNASLVTTTESLEPLLEAEADTMPRRQSPALIIKSHTQHPIGVTSCSWSPSSVTILFQVDQTRDLRGNLSPLLLDIDSVNPGGVPRRAPGHVQTCSDWNPSFSWQDF